LTRHRGPLDASFPRLTPYDIAAPSFLSEARRRIRRARVGITPRVSVAILPIDAATVSTDTNAAEAYRETGPR